MSYQTILYETEGRIARITLNRPEKLNAIRPPMPDEVEAASRHGKEGQVFIFAVVRIRLIVE